MLSRRILIQNRLNIVFTIKRCVPLVKYCTKTNENDENRPKTITEKFDEAIKKIEGLRAAAKATKGEKNRAKATNGKSKLLKPVDGYTPRFKYNGYVKKSQWIYFDDDHNEKVPETEEQFNYGMRKKHKYCLLLAFAGGNYYGMQYNVSTHTIEDELLKSMVKNRWILQEHLDRPHLFDFQRGSRTDRGVSACRMNVSAVLPIDVSIEDLNRDLPSDIRVFGMKRTTPTFDARHNCTARTYSYTMPTIAFSHYNDQTEMKDYRITADRLLRANEIFGMFKGYTNFHNYTMKKQYFDRSSSRRIEEIGCGEPFIEGDIEFIRMTVKGQSFMLHQIRKMVGFTLAVIRGVVGDDMLKRSLTKEVFHTPTAPGLGLMLERLHFSKYARLFKDHDPLTFDEFDNDVEEFRRNYIHPFIIETEIKENSMVNWLEYLCIHSFSAESREREENRKMRNDPEFDDEWGEDPEFLEKLKKRLEE
ncbi:tRNA pseudouridine synthase A-like [Contarinia nasturtii]|uniref:tRNA pseudouridine synthase A-like n=1 Tax=Contarinia nasturtii TaxID=265458 RepID=UPI0012D3810C|nr:tRNA pseudouridine synthase A-like [Contarinia nasturtii]